VYEQPVSSLDVFTTALTAAGVKVPADRPIDSVDLLPFLSSKQDGPPHESLFWRYGPNQAVRMGNWKLVRQAARGSSNADFQLFDLSRDIGEETDLAGHQPEVAKKLWQEAERWNRQMVEPLWGGIRTGK
jgi:arylsulfatase A-like enzyme